MRGAAALCVLLYHLGLWSDAPLAAHGFLAVDLFFCLSGFVLGHAYGHRIQSGMTAKAFMLARLQRLYPMIALGALGGAAYCVLHGLTHPESADPAATAIGVGLALLVLPYFNAPATIGGPQVFPINGPEWSLFFELAINLAWVLAFRRLSIRIVWIIAVIAAIATVFMEWGGTHTDSFLGGFPRVAVSFAAGLIIYDLFRQGRLPWLRLHPFFAVGFCVAALLRPGADWDRWVDHGLVFLGAPLLVLAAAQYQQATRLDPLLRFAGLLSYPFYLLQVPVVSMLTGGLRAFGIALAPALEMGLTVGVVIAAAWAATIAVDQPLRALAAGRKVSAPRAAG